MEKAIAVVGFGCAGYHAVKAMREQGYAGQIDVYSDSEWAPANPMLTTYYVYGKLQKEATLPFGAFGDLSEKYGFSVIQGTVASVRSKERGVLLTDGTVRYYDQILIAVGAKAFVPPIEGITSEGVLTMRTMKDAEHLKSILTEKRIGHAVVVGASMVGIKLVELFHDRGISCTLVDMASGIFPVSAVPVVAREIEGRLMQKGIKLRFSKALQRIEEKNGQKSVVFADGESITCDLVMMCIGTRANTEVADEGILKKRGIVVDQNMRTSIPGIYSAGDCSEGTNLQTGETQIIGIWDNAARQGETAGINMAGAQAKYQGNILHNITHFMGMDFIGYGDVRCEGEEYIYENPEKGQLFAIRVQGDVPVCMNLLDSYGSSGVLKAYMLQKIDGKKEGLSPVAYVRLVNEGVPLSLIKLLMKGQEKKYEESN